MTPHATRPPALPVFKDSSLPPLPKSSEPACTTMALPTMELGPVRGIWESVKEITARLGVSGVVFMSVVVYCVYVWCGGSGL